MTPDTRSDLWIGPNGRVACFTHGGHYLQAALNAGPRSVHVVTPLGEWVRVPNDLAEPYLCENC